MGSANHIKPLAGYHLQEEIYAGTRTVVYRAIENATHNSVIVKLLRAQYPSLVDLLQLRNQYSIAKNLNLPGVVRPYGLEPYGNSYALIMEDFGGVPLSETLAHQPNGSYAIDEFLSIALQLADLLEGLHRHRVIHKDIKPANILINPETGTVKLIDFSLSSLLPREVQQIQSPNVLEGTLAYIAPEQTGRMNRGIDYRADFYSLGVTFYELLTGELPFQYSEPIQLIHAHIAQTPPSVCDRNPKVPPLLGQLVAKLMAKNAEARYQSASGLKADLETGQAQWQANGKIERFELGTQDWCERFNISEKLYGREREVQALLLAFDRVAAGKAELLLVAGFSGIGKTAVIHEVHKPIARQHGYFIQGKFDQFNRDIPLSAFVRALNDLIEQLSGEDEARLDFWRARILETVGENGQILREVIPRLEGVIGPQPPAPELSGSEAQKRFNLLLEQFIQIFARVEHPLVLFLDDLQWADLASLQLLKVLIERSHYLLVLGAYRDNEVSPTHPLIQCVEDLKKGGRIVNTVTLEPLTPDDTNAWLADTLHCAIAIAKPLGQLIQHKTQGNPFFTTQFLKMLHEEGHLRFNPEYRHWECDIARVEALAITEDIVTFTALQLQKLPPETQRVLQLAACMGHQFDLQTIAIISEQTSEQVATALWEALHDGLVLPTRRIYKFFPADSGELAAEENWTNPSYRFLHDRIQQAAYSLIPEARKIKTHYRIGQLLLQQTPPEAQQERIFDLVTHLNFGIPEISEPTQREQLARLNLIAGQKARNSTAYNAAQNFIKTGLQLLPADCWQSQYELALELSLAAAENAYLNADFEEMEAICDRVLQSAHTLLDKVKIYEIQIKTLTAGRRPLEAIEIGLKALEQLGIALPQQPDEAQTLTALQVLAEKLKSREIEALINLPETSNPQAVAAMQLFGILFGSIVTVKPSLLPLLACTTIDLSLEFGNAPVSASGYISYGMVLITLFGEVESGYRFGRLAVDLLEQFHEPLLKCFTLLTFALFIQPRKQALRGTIPLLKEAYASGIDRGDFLNAGYSICGYFFAHFLSGSDLKSWGPEIKDYCLTLSQLKQDYALTNLRMQEQVYLNSIQNVEQPHLLKGDAYDETTSIAQHFRDNEGAAIVLVYVSKLILAYLFARYESASDYVKIIHENFASLGGVVHTAFFYFYAGLTYLSQAATQSLEDRSKTLLQVEQWQAVLTEWASHAPMNYQHQVNLIEAEKCRVLGNKANAIELYDRAIAAAKVNAYTREEALANELAAQFYLTWGKAEIARTYLIQAYYTYARWGANAKTAELESQYSSLLEPVLRQNIAPVSATETAFDFAFFPDLSALENRLGSSHSSSLLATFDLTTILRASQTLSSEIELDKLLATLLEIVLQNAGADRAVLIMPQGEEWFIEAIAHLGQPARIESRPLARELELPRGLIHKILATREAVAIADATLHPRLLDDAYIRQQQPKSLLCTPILNQGKLVAILYLENRIAAAAFTRDRLELLNFLCAQAAISLENARLYRQAQNYAQQLEQSQLQIVQSEKMASLGNLVAGVAHEINNPVGFLNGSLRNSRDFLTDLLEHLALYREELENPSDGIQDHAEAIDVEFLERDFPKLLESMQGALDRIKSISNSLRTFSRADSENKVPTDLHEGLDSTLLILKYRLKANPQRPAIQVVKNYGKVPPIAVFSGQLNQVFMNLLANAIDALDEAAQKSSYAALLAHPQQISIETTWNEEEQKVGICIRDNGEGIPPELQSKIFEHLFTTKDVGKGTGLGLAIARQIVVEKHGGSLEVRSLPEGGTAFCIKIPQEQ